MDLEFEGKVAIVTGGASGIGTAVVEGFAVFAFVFALVLAGSLPGGGA